MKEAAAETIISVQNAECQNSRSKIKAATTVFSVLVVASPRPVSDSQAVYSLARR